MNASDAIPPFAGQREFLDEEYDRALPLLLPLAQSGRAEAQFYEQAQSQGFVGEWLPDAASPVT